MGRAVPADDLPGAFDLKSALAETDKALKLPDGLSAAQIQIESGGNPRAKSKAGAMGLAQVMPQTLAVISKRLGRDLDPYNEQDAVEIHREVMRENLGKFKDPSKALMAYNGGWDESKWGNSETAAYVGKINAQRNKQTPIVKAADKVLRAVSGTANASSRAVPADDLPDIPSTPPKQSNTEELAQGAKNLGMGLLRGAKDVVDTGAQFLSSGFDKIAGTKEGERVRGLNAAGNKEFDQQYGDSTAASVGRVGGNIAATLPVGGILGAAAKVSGAAPSVVNALTTSGFRAGASTPAKNLLARTVGGGVTGGVSSGLVNADDAVTGAAIGAALPGVLGAGGKVGQMIGKGIRGNEVAPEVTALAKRAKDLGINIPADRLVDSKPLNALASSLNYVPFSGRAAVETNMEKQLNRALSRTFGQDSDNVTGALRSARDDLGAKFDAVLKSNTVKVDDDFLTALGDIQKSARAELGQDGLRAIDNQIDELMSKGATGVIDGQAAYNIKRTLDRIGKRTTPEAYQARELNQALMGALDRSIGPEEAAKFAATRKQYGNMMALRKLAGNGAEGDISIGRLANLKNINNKELQELADISAQFLKTREAPHGAAQRVGAGGLAAYLGGPGALAAGVAGGRAANSLLNSNMAKNFVMPAKNLANSAPTNSLLGTGFYRAAPLIGADL